MYQETKTSGKIPAVIRRSTSLFVIKIIFLELFFEIIYLTWRVIIQILPVSIELVITLNSISLIIFLILVTFIQNAFLVYLALQWTNDYYEIGDKEVSHISGIISKTKKSYPYRDIQSIVVHQGFLGRLLNYGEVVIYIPTLTQDLHFRGIADPEKFANLIKSSHPMPKEGKYIFRR